MQMFFQFFLNPVKVGNVVSLPHGSVVPVAVNGNVVPVRTIPAPILTFHL